MRFLDGDVVKIAKNSRFYGSGESNPKDTEGTVRVIQSSIWQYSVNWGEGRNAGYNDNDLRLVRRSNEISRR